MANKFRVGRVIAVGALLLALAAAVGLILLDWRAGLALIGGLGGGALLYGYFRLLRACAQRGPIWPYIVIPALLIGVGWAVWSFLSLGRGAFVAQDAPSSEGALPSDQALPESADEESPTSNGDDLAGSTGDAPEATISVIAYRLFMTADAEAQFFTAEEEIVYDVYIDGQQVEAGQVLTLPAGQVPARPDGFLLNRVEYQPLGGANLAFPQPVSLPGGMPALMTVCPAGLCPPATVELRDMPRSAFVAARDAPDHTVLPFVNTETIDFAPQNLRRGVAFSFIRPPLNALRPLFEPLLGATTVSEWVVGLAGVVAGVIFFPLAAAIVENYLEGKAIQGAKGIYKRLRPGQPGEQPSQKVRRMSTGEILRPRGRKTPPED